MSESAAPPEAKRPWWVPLLGVGSIGFGGLQALGGVLVAVWGAQVEGESARVLAGLGAAWLLPGALLAAAGAGVVLGARWGRALSLAAVAAGGVAVALVASNRLAIPPAVADAIEETSRHPDVRSSPLADTLARIRRDPAGDPVASLRNPDMAEVTGWTFTGYCACPILPWYLTVLFACGGPWGRRITQPDRS